MYNYNDIELLQTSLKCARAIFALSTTPWKQARIAQLKVCNASRLRALNIFSRIMEDGMVADVWLLLVQR